MRTTIFTTRNDEVDFFHANSCTKYYSVLSKYKIMTEIAEIFEKIADHRGVAKYGDLAQKWYTSPSNLSFLKNFGWGKKYQNVLGCKEKVGEHHDIYFNEKHETIYGNGDTLVADIVEYLPKEEKTSPYEYSVQYKYIAGDFSRKSIVPKKSYFQVPMFIISEIVCEKITLPSGRVVEDETTYIQLNPDWKEIHSIIGKELEKVDVYKMLENRLIRKIGKQFQNYMKDLTLGGNEKKNDFDFIDFLGRLEKCLKDNI